MSRSTERLIYLLESVNATAISNDAERGYGIGDHIAELCHEAARRLRENETIAQEAMKLIREQGAMLHGDEPDWLPNAGDHGC